MRNKPSIVDFVHNTWVAVRNGTVIGFCCWDWLDQAAGSARTVLICVRPEARSLRVGDALQAARQEDMCAAGAVEVHTWSDDPRVVNWYCRKFGYERLGTEPIHHTLHLFVCDSKAAWGIHRGHLEFGQLTHLRLAMRRADVSSAAATSPELGRRVMSGGDSSCDGATHLQLPRFVSQRADAP